MQPSVAACCGWTQSEASALHVFRRSAYNPETICGFERSLTIAIDERTLSASGAWGCFLPSRHASASRGKGDRMTFALRSLPTLGAQDIELV